jgi:hypothetical protein
LLKKIDQKKSLFLLLIYFFIGGFSMSSAAAPPASAALPDTSFYYDPTDFEETEEVYIPPTPFQFSPGALYAHFGLSQEGSEESQVIKRTDAILGASAKTFEALQRYYNIPNKQLSPPRGLGLHALLNIIYKANIVILFWDEMNRIWGDLPPGLPFSELFDNVNRWLQNQLFKTTTELSFKNLSISVLPKELPSLYPNLLNLSRLKARDSCFIAPVFQQLHRL